MRKNDIRNFPSLISEAVNTRRVSLAILTQPPSARAAGDGSLRASQAPPYA